MRFISFEILTTGVLRLECAFSERSSDFVQGSRFTDLRFFGIAQPSYRVDTRGVAHRARMVQRTVVRCGQIMPNGSIYLAEVLTIGSNLPATSAACAAAGRVRAACRAAGLTAPNRDVRAYRPNVRRMWGYYVGLAPVDCIGR